MPTHPPVDSSSLRQRFISSSRPHLLMITNHGVHEWQVVPGLPDTGGQNVYVNHMAEACVELGCRVTIVNRGGYPHPTNNHIQRGEVYHPSGLARILYVEDGLAEFVRKEDMDEQLPTLADDLDQRLREDGVDFQLIISHYWDAAKLGNLLNERSGQQSPHVWIPHSLGALKKQNMPPDTWANLRIDERIAHEHELLRHINGGVATSAAIRETFEQAYEYDCRYFLPPCVDEQRFRPLPAEEIEPIWEFLASHSVLTAEEIKARKIITEISRTDKTKRKDILISAFLNVKRQVPDALLAVSIDPRSQPLHDQLLALIREIGLERDVIVLGSVWDQLPLLYNATDVYCTPSIMEGFGMSPQEAAATGKAVVSSDLVPFAVEYLAGPKAEKTVLGEGESTREVLVGDGGIVVPADDVHGFTLALTRLLEDDAYREAMGQRAFDITIPYFTWNRMTASLLSDLGIKTNGESGTAA